MHPNLAISATCSHHKKVLTYHQGLVRISDLLYPPSQDVPVPCKMPQIRPFVIQKKNDVHHGYARLASPLPMYSRMITFITLMVLVYVVPRLVRHWFPLTCLSDNLSWGCFVSSGRPLNDFLDSEDWLYISSIKPPPKSLQHSLVDRSYTCYVRDPILSASPLRFQRIILVYS